MRPLLVRSSAATHGRGAGVVGSWLVAVLAGCSGPATGPRVPCGIGSSCAATQRLASLTLAPAVDTALVGDALQITFMARDSKGNAITGIPAAYHSSDPQVATVDSTGLIRAVGPGTTTITIAAGGLRASSQLTVLARTVVQLSAGSDAGCLELPLGRGYCWGVDGAGQLGFTVGTTCFDSGASAGAVPCEVAPAAISGGLRFATLSTGGVHTCGLTSLGAAYCWGDNTFGELGTNTVAASPAPLAVSGVLRFGSITAGGAHTCGLTTDDRAFCWGSDSAGQLGDAGTVNSTTPIPVVGGGAFVALTAGFAHTCGVTAARAAFCWGSNALGQLGTGSAGDHSTPVAVAGGLAFTALSAGVAHTCGIVTGGGVYCWGAYGSGTSPTPVFVSGVLAFTQVSAGGAFTCGVSGTAAYCWGIDPDGEVGNGGIGGTAVTPVRVVGGYAFQSVSAGTRHACGIVQSGQAVCWGSNLFGALGNSLQAAVRGAPVVVGTPLS